MINGSAKRILIVDGDRDSRTVFGILLNHHGYEVVEAEDGAEALTLLSGARFDVVITELTLRRLDGHALLETARTVANDICVVVVTARALEEDRTRAQEAGCALYLTKPLEPQQLVQEIRGLIG
jgi:CheY-like chemotaxis protein